MARYKFYIVLYCIVYCRLFCVFFCYFATCVLYLYGISRGETKFTYKPDHSRAYCTETDSRHERKWFSFTNNSWLSLSKRLSTRPWPYKKYTSQSILLAKPFCGLVFSSAEAKKSNNNALSASSTWRC